MTMEYCLKARKDIILDCLDRCPAFQGVLAHVTTEPALLHSAKWNIRTEHRPCIHCDLTRLNGFRNAVGAVDVVGEKGCTQTVMGVVGFGNDFFLGGELGNALFLGMSIMEMVRCLRILLTATGPKISSRMIVASSATSAKAVF